MSEERTAEVCPPRTAPVVFGPAASQLFGLYHAPDPAAARPIGVVLCNPLGYEAMCTHRAYRHLAERLAVAGFHALRFDYHGTGDSSGDAAEPARVRAWLDSIDAAIDALRAVTGVGTVDLVGVRFGATLAAVAAGRRRDVQSVVLWAPCASGRAYVRELRAFRMLTGHDERGAPDASREGGEEIAGYRFEQATVRDLTAIDLLAQHERIADRALVLPRDDLLGVEARLVSHLEACGVEARLRAEPGYKSMMRDPQDTLVPFATLDAIVAWLGESPEPGAVCAPAAGVSSSVLIAESGAARRPVREESLHFGEDGRLFGILTEPSPGATRSGRPAVVFLNVGANHRVGPNRMYVSLARDLAARGYLGFRFDLGGFGDSPRGDGIEENLLYSKDSVGDVKTALTFLSSIRHVDRFVLLGVCSGAYQAFHTGAEDPRVAGQILINAQTFEWKEGDSLGVSVRKSFKSTRYYLDAVMDRDVWARALRGDLDLRGVEGVLRERFAERIGAKIQEALARGLGRPAPCSDITRAFCAMSDRGTESLLVFSSSDGGLDMIEKHLGPDAEKMRGRKNVRFAIVEGADHTFTSLASQRELCSLVTSFVEGAFP